MPNDGTYTAAEQPNGPLRFRAISRTANQTIANVREFSADSDVAAAAIARDMADNCPIELWGEHGLVEYFEALNA